MWIPAANAVAFGRNNHNKPSQDPGGTASRKTTLLLSSELGLQGLSLTSDKTKNKENQPGNKVKLHKEVLECR